MSLSGRRLGDRATSLAPWVRRGALPALVLAWGLLNLVWLRAFRWTRYADLDEAAYMGMTARLADLSWSDRWFVLRHEGVHGPLQAMLAAPVMAATRVDLRVLIVVNLVLVGVTALATGALVRRLVGPGAGALAGVVVLCAPGVVEMGRTAMTAVLPMCAAALALAALERSDGLRRLGWCGAAGAAVGAMTLGRSMAIGFVPMVAVAGLTWAWSRRTSVSRVLLGGAVVATAAAATALWWWWIRWSDVSAYLFGGGSADTERLSDPVGKAGIHIEELVVAIGPVSIPLLVAGVLGLVVLSRRAPSGGSGGDGQPRPPGRGVVEWPLVLSVLTGLLVLALSSAPGIGFTLPLVPASVGAAVVALRRVTATSASWWRAAASTVAVVAVAGAVVLPGRGLDLPTVFGCGIADEAVKVQCSVDSNEDGEAWRSVNDRVADRIAAILAVTPSEAWVPGAPPVAMTVRDTGVSPNTVGLALQMRHGWGSELWSYFDPGLAHDEQIAALLGSARAIVVVDEPPGDAIVGTFAPPSDRVLDAALDAGFRPCETVPMPDGRDVRIVVDDRVPVSACPDVPG